MVTDILVWSSLVVVGIIVLGFVWGGYCYWRSGHNPRPTVREMVRNALRDWRDRGADKTITVLVLTLLLSGCITMSPDAERVRVVYNPLELGADCAALGTVTSWSGWGGFAMGAAYENVERDMRDDTAARGGNVLLALYARGGDLSGVSSRGQAYHCPSAHP